MEDKKKKERKKRKGFCLKLDYDRDAKIIEQLEKCKNKQGYIKKLILNDLTYAGPFI